HGSTGFDAGYGIAVDAAGAAYVTGSTQSVDFPTANALQPAFRGYETNDAFVSKLTADGSALAYSTFLGGSDFDASRSIAVDAVAAAYAIGTTRSSAFPIAHAIQPTFGGGGHYVLDAFVSKLTADGSALAYSTSLGGSDDEEGAGIAVDAAGAAYVTG